MFFVQYFESLQNQAFILGVVILNERALHFSFSETLGGVNSLPPERVFSGVINAAGGRHRKRNKILYLLRPDTAARQIQRKRQSIRESRARVSADEIIDQIEILMYPLFCILKFFHKRLI